MSLIHERPQCPYCLKRFHVNGIGNHKRTCKQRIEQDIVDLQFNLEQGPSQAANTAQEAANTPRLLFNNQVPSNTGLDSCFEDLQLDSQRDLASSPSFEPGSYENESSSDDDIIDAANAILDLVNPYNPKFCIEYHPSAILDPRILTCEEYFQIMAVEMMGSFIDKPWHPFASENDFELAELILHTGMNHQERDSYFKSQAEHLLVMSSLPPGGKPLAYILYADKTHLSSFGTAKGYPVMARIANLPDAICNGKGWGGGTVVGWLPIVEEDPKHKGKPSWINFNCMMTLICGVHSSHPCPVCLAPDKKLMDITEVYPLRTTENMQKLYDQAQEKGDSILQSSGLRDVENVFWSIEQSDLYRAVSWDRLHAYHLGLFKHLLLHLLEHVENIQGPDKRKAKVIIDEFIANFPRWQNMIHFPNVTTFDFSDALKFENMSKANNPSAYLLLKVIQSYLELDMYTSMDVHMEKSIEEGRQLLGVFEANLKAYSQATDNIVWKNVTSWSIPKVHTQQHLFDDIIAKGVTKNYNTKVNECMHGPLKEAYQTRTNFKNVADQILMTDHRYGIAMKLQQRMDHNKKHQKEAMASVEQETKVSSKAKRHNRQMQNIQPLDSKASLHSLWFTPRDPRTLEELEAAFHSDPAYEHFQICLGLFMTTFLNMVEKGTVAAGKYIQYRPNDMSLVNFKKSTDLLCCSPSFYNHPCYDGVIINTDEGVYIGRLVQLFECEYLEQ
ncbi:hypothetical protein EDD18DRAFT_1112326 [Armillaria luteobubalina]|uniref:Transposase domain-containing protein n=1 Tax=Armillaria luteobubalina TaxID=153913 RepID=A0AA39PF19_9AGAR|nr:hypothetical protein EDD18DRAFT_1112326 [Armillaria luteobubalina]